MTNQENTSIITPRLIVQLLIVLVLIPLLPMIISGNWTWLEAWVYAGIHIVGFILSRYLVSLKHPDLIAERAKGMDHDDAKSWDKILSPMMALGIVFILIVAGLDVRFGWSPEMSLPVELVALVFILAGWVLGSYALLENRFFSGLVRIQTDRGHQVVSTGPYAWIRHPGYAGALIMYLATPFFLDSLWAFIPAVLLCIVAIIRTALEDQTLQAELDGYREFAQKVRYRLLPYIW